MNDTAKTKIIIEGVTDAGQEFRPSDWAERMSGNLSTFNNHRIHYSPLLQPMVKDGHRCIMLDPALKQTDLALYESILEFARVNHLKICNEEEHD